MATRGQRSGRGPALLAGFAALFALVVVVTVGARPSPVGSAGPSAPSPTGSAGPTAEPTRTPRPTAEPTSPPLGPLDGLHLVLDPGHNGGNAAAPAEVTAAVGDGRGGTKACNTVGTATADGYPEHAFNLDVALRTRDLLEAGGAEVTLTRADDDGVGPCVDERGRSAQEAGADALVSIHADGSADPSVAGFFAIVAEPPLHDAQGPPSVELAEELLSALADAGFRRATGYSDGLSRRADLATLNWAERPAVLLELAQMRNPDEAEVASSAEGRQRYAEAVAAGVRTWSGVRTSWRRPGPRRTRSR